MAGSNVRIELLSKSNYENWKIHMRAVLIKNDAWGYVSGTIPRPVGEDEKVQEETARWADADLKAQSGIILGKSPSLLKLVKGCNTAKGIWKKLEETYAR